MCCNKCLFRCVLKQTSASNGNHELIKESNFSNSERSETLAICWRSGCG